MMKNLCLTLFLVIFTPQLAAAKDIEIPAVPASADEFTEWRDKVATTPEGGAAATVAALMAFSKDKKLGLQCLTLMLDQRNVGNGDVIKGHAPIGAIMYHVNRISGYDIWPFLAFAYVKGGKAEKNYAVDPPYIVVTSRQKNSGSDSSGEVQVFVDCDGFRARPISLHRNDKGIWKAYEMSSLFLNVSPPASATPVDDL